MSTVGIGVRRDFMSEFISSDILQPDFVEFAPENWMGMGGIWKKKLDIIAQKYPILCHGLSLSIGSPEDLDYKFIKEVKQFLDDYKVQIYSEHLSYSKCNNAHLYELLPIPFREDAVKHIASRIREVQDILERKIAIENVSYYTPVAAEMEEHEFISAIVAESDCNLLLDVNNVYVNAFNHKYDAKEFIKNMPLDKVAYVHMAGHDQISDDLIIDTHGAPIIDPVYDLFEWTIPQLKDVPVLLERDFNIEGLEDLQSEIGQLKTIIERSKSVAHVG